MLTKDDLRALAADLLGTPPGDDDHLIELGLDSLKLMRIANKCRRAGFDVSFAELAREPRIAAWAELAGTEPAPDTAPVAEKVADGVPFPLATMQHAYWVGRGGSQELGSVAAHLYTEFDGANVDPGRLTTALAAVAARHLMLRARFTDDGQQVIGPWHGEPIPVLDLRDVDDPEPQLAKVRDEMSHQLLDVANGRVIDLRVSMLPGGRTRVHVDVDMLAADARSYRTLLAELVHFYVLPDEPLPALGFQYAQYLAERRAQPPKEADVAWWRERLADLPGAPALPAGNGGAANRVTRLHHWLDPRQRADLHDQARAHAVTPAATVAAAYAEALGAWSGEPKFLLNVPMFDRRPVHPDVEGLVGDFTGSVLLPVDLTEPLTFAERVAAVQRSLHEAAAHASYSGLDVLRDLTREHGTPVLAPVVFTSALNLGELFGSTVEGVLGEPVHIVSQGPQVILDAQVTELHGGLLVNWDVRADAFPDGAADAMFAAFRTLLADLPWDRPVGNLLPAAQLAVRDGVNATDGPLPTGPLHAAFFAHATTHPDAPATLPAVQSRGSAPRLHRMTYGGLADQALRTAGWLRAQGVVAGDAVAIRLPKGAGQLVAVLGVLAAGGHYVPIGVEQPVARVDRIRARANVTVVLDDGTAPAAAAWAEPLPAPVLADPNAIAYVLFTSGSTGEPKGVEVSHRAARNTVDDLTGRLGMTAADRTLALSALDFDLSVFDVFAPLSTGGAVVTVDETGRKDAVAWARAVREQGVTILNCVPSLLDMLLTAGARDGLGMALRAVLLGGDRVGVDLPGRLREQLPDCRFFGLGGTTETAIHSTILEVANADPQWTCVPYGTPLRNVRCRVVDAQGRDCPDWVAGELWIGGAGVADGYRGDPARTADRFVEYQGRRWYRTGDRARYQPDGGLEFLGRADDQVKIRGFRIELGEVEAALVDHPAVRHATALVLRTGPTPRLVAVVVGDVSEGALATHLADRLPPHMVPDHVTVLADLPFTANGKVDRKALTALAASSGPAIAFEPPVTPVEQVVAMVWAEVLAADRVGRSDDYFQLGGDSVLATVITGRLRDALDSDDVTVHDVLSSLTVGRLAERLTGRDADGRLVAVAEVWLEVAALTSDEVDARLG